MKRTMYCFTLISLLFSFTSPLMAQPGSTAVPFLLISPSTEANGMGGNYDKRDADKFFGNDL